MGPNSFSIDSRLESPMRGLQRMAASPESSAHNALNARNGVSACSRDFFLGIPNLSGEISMLSGKIPNLFFAGTSFFSCGEGRISRRQAWNSHFQIIPRKKQVWGFPGQVRPAKKEAWNFQKRAGIFAANLIRKRDRFGIAKKKLRPATQTSGIHGVQKRVCRAQSCPAKHPDGYRETLFRRLRT